MYHRIRALVVVPVLFLIFTLQPYLENLQPDLSEKDSITSKNFIEKNTPTVSIEENPPNEKFGIAPLPDYNEAAFIDPETAVIEVFFVETPSPVEIFVTEEEKTLQLTVFTELWAVVNEIYLYPDFNGVDWLATRRQVREKIEKGLSLDDFYREMEQVLRSLGDEHSFYLTPEKVAAQEAKFAGNMNFAGIGVISKPVAEKGSSVILLTFPGGPADLAGLQPRDSILAVDGIPILDENGAARDLIRGPEGSDIILTVQRPYEEIRQVSITRGRISGPIPIPTYILTSEKGKRIGYMLLVSFADSTIEERIGQEISNMSAEGELDGLIIDNRFNEGGADLVLKGALSYFSEGLLGHFISRKAESPFEVAALDINGSQHLPVVVIVGPRTVSYGEIFSGILQDLGRAFLVGEPTRGNVETLSGHNFSDGSRAWIAYKAFRPLNNPDQDWEQHGVIPDLAAPLDWGEDTLENDPAVLAALQYIDFGEIISYYTD
jgi:carboxyl-terminal processing protease